LKHSARGTVFEGKVTGDRKSGLFWEQKPPLTGESLLKMLGRCTFEKTEYRAPKASYTAERHVWLTRLNNLRIATNGEVRPFNDAERAAVLPLPYQQASNFTYKQARTALVKQGLLPEDFRFVGLRYPAQAENSKDPETEKLIQLPAWQKFRETLTKAGLKTEWEGIVGMAAGGNPEQFDQIAWVLSVYKDGDEVERELRKLNLSGGEEMLEALGTISFDKFHNLSLKALRKIVPFMEQGQRYDEACGSAGYHHSQLFKSGEGKEKYLPPFYAKRDKDGQMVFRDDADIPRNPVVLRALNQARKVLNALVHEYGSPGAVHIEMARDLSRPLDERRDIEKMQKEYKERNDKAKADFAHEFKVPAKSREFEKFLLYREQQSRCAYSLEPLDLDRVLHEPGYAEIDHVLPYSRSYDDSKNNKVLILTKINRDKGNQTPYEYMIRLDGGVEGTHWRNFVAFVESNKSYRLAKCIRLLRKHFSEKEAEEFRDRNLNDTRYICKFFKKYVEEHLLLAGESKRCVVLSGQLTAFLRTRWGFNKVRGDNDRHHALDAAVIAACSHALVKRLSDYARRRELENPRNVIDAETGEIVNPELLTQLENDFPRPWKHFREEVLLRLNQDNLQLLKSEAKRMGYPPEAVSTLRPLFVSRAPQRRNGGAAHKETIYAQTEALKMHEQVAQKVLLSSLKLSDFNKLIDPHRNERLYSAIYARLKAHDNKGDKAFPSDNPLRKPDRDGNPTGPIVRTVTKVDTLTGIPVRGGIAKNDVMLRVDVFRHKKDDKYHLVPIYAHHRVAKILPDRAIIAFKNETEWTAIDEANFEFCFSLFANDFIRVTFKGKVIEGYYAGCDRSTGNVGIWAHDRNIGIGKDGFIRTGVKIAQLLEKFNVDVLGHIYTVPQEERRGLA